MSSLRTSNFCLFWDASIPLVTSPERWRFRLLSCCMPYLTWTVTSTWHIQILQYLIPLMTTNPLNLDHLLSTRTLNDSKLRPCLYNLVIKINMKMCNTAYLLLHSCPCHIVSPLALIYWNWKSSFICADDTSNHISVFIWYVIAGPCTVSRNNSHYWYLAAKVASPWEFRRWKTT